MDKINIPDQETQSGFEESQKLEFGENAGEGFSQESQQTEKSA